MSRPKFQERLQRLFTAVFHNDRSPHGRYVDRIAGEVAAQLGHPLDTPLHEIDLLDRRPRSPELLLGCHLAVALTWDLAITACRDELHRQEGLLRQALADEPPSPASVAAARAAHDMARSLVDPFERRAPAAVA